MLHKKRSIKGSGVDDSKKKRKTSKLTYGEFQVIDIDEKEITIDLLRKESEAYKQKTRMTLVHSFPGNDKSAVLSPKNQYTYKVGGGLAIPYQTDQTHSLDIWVQPIPSRFFITPTFEQQQQMIEHYIACLYFAVAKGYGICVPIRDINGESGSKINVSTSFTHPQKPPDIALKEGKEYAWGGGLAPDFSKQHGDFLENELNKLNEFMLNLNQAQTLEEQINYIDQLREPYKRAFQEGKNISKDWYGPPQNGLPTNQSNEVANNNDIPKEKNTVTNQIHVNPEINQEKIDAMDIVSTEDNNVYTESDQNLLKILTFHTDWLFQNLSFTNIKTLPNAKEFYLHINALRNIEHQYNRTLYLQEQKKQFIHKIETSTSWQIAKNIFISIYEKEKYKIRLSFHDGKLIKLIINFRDGTDQERHITPVKITERIFQGILRPGMKKEKVRKAILHQLDIFKYDDLRLLQASQDIDNFIEENKTMLETDKEQINLKEHVDNLFDIVSKYYNENEISKSVLMKEIPEGNLTLRGAQSVIYQILKGLNKESESIQAIFDYFSHPNMMDQVEDLCSIAAYFYNERIQLNMSDDYIKIPNKTPESYLVATLDFGAKKYHYKGEGKFVQMQSRILTCFNWIVDLSNQDNGDSLNIQDYDIKEKNIAEIKKRVLAEKERAKSIIYHENELQKPLTSQELNQVIYAIYSIFDYMPLPKNAKNPVKKNRNAKSRYQEEPIDRLYQVAATHLQFVFAAYPMLKECYYEEITNGFLRYLTYGVTEDDLKNLGITQEKIKAEQEKKKGKKYSLQDFTNANNARGFCEQYQPQDFATYNLAKSNNDQLISQLDVNFQQEQSQYNIDINQVLVQYQASFNAAVQQLWNYLQLVYGNNAEAVYSNCYLEAIAFHNQNINNLQQSYQNLQGEMQRFLNLIQQAPVIYPPFSLPCHQQFFNDMQAAINQYHISIQQADANFQQAEQQYNIDKSQAQALMQQPKQVLKNVCEQFYVNMRRAVIDMLKSRDISYAEKSEASDFSSKKMLETFNADIADLNSFVLYKYYFEYKSIQQNFSNLPESIQKLLHLNGGHFNELFNKNLNLSLDWFKTKDSNIPPIRWLVFEAIRNTYYSMYDSKDFPSESIVAMMHLFFDIYKKFNYKYTTNAEMLWSSQIMGILEDPIQPRVQSIDDNLGIYNAIALGIKELVQLDMLPEYCRQHFYAFMQKQLNLSSATQESFKAWLKDKSSDAIQKTLAPLLRIFVFSSLYENHHGHSDAYISELQIAFSKFIKDRSYQDFNFLIHPHIQNEFNRIADDNNITNKEDELIKWWKQKGAKQYFQDMQTHIMQSNTEINDAELVALTCVLNLNLDWKKPGKEMQSANLGAGLIYVNLKNTAQQAQSKKLIHLGLGNNYFGYFRLNNETIKSTTDLQQRLTLENKAAQALSGFLLNVYYPQLYLTGNPSPFIPTDDNQDIIQLLVDRNILSQGYVYNNAGGYYPIYSLTESFYKQLELYFGYPGIPYLPVSQEIIDQTLDLFDQACKYFHQHNQNQIFPFPEFGNELSQRGIISQFLGQDNNVYCFFTVSYQADIIARLQGSSFEPVQQDIVNAVMTFFNNGDSAKPFPIMERDLNTIVVLLRHNIIQYRDDGNYYLTTTDKNLLQTRLNGFEPVLQFQIENIVSSYQPAIPKLTIVYDSCWSYMRSPEVLKKLNWMDNLENIPQGEQVTFIDNPPNYPPKPSLTYPNPSLTRSTTYSQNVEYEINKSQNLPNDNIPILTCGDGNCAFNAMALGIADLAKTDQLPMTEQRQNFYTFLQEKLGLDEGNLVESFKKWILSRTDDEIQKQLSPHLRAFAVSVINKQYYLYYKDLYEPRLVEAFDLYLKGKSYKDDTFIVHSFIKEEFKKYQTDQDDKNALKGWWDKEGKTKYGQPVDEQKLFSAFDSYLQGEPYNDNTFIVHPFIEEEFKKYQTYQKKLTAWWDTEGRKKYFESIGSPAEFTWDQERWGSEVEPNAIAVELDIKFSYKRGANASDGQSLGIGGGIIPLDNVNIDDLQTWLAGRRNIAQQTLGYFRIHEFSSLSELEQPFGEVSKATRVFVENNYGETKGITLTNEIIPIITVLIERNIVTRDENKKYYFVSLSPEELNKRLGAIPDELQKLVRQYYRNDSPKISIRFSASHWNYLRSPATQEKLKGLNLDTLNNMDIDETSTTQIVSKEFTTSSNNSGKNLLNDIYVKLEEMFSCTIKFADNKHTFSFNLQKKRSNFWQILDEYGINFSIENRIFYIDDANFTKLQEKLLANNFQQTPSTANNSEDDSKPLIDLTKYKPSYEIKDKAQVWATLQGKHEQDISNSQKEQNNTTPHQSSDDTSSIEIKNTSESPSTRSNRM